MSSDEGPGWSGMFARLKAGLTRTATALSSGLTGLFTKKRLDAETIQALEEALIRADVGADLAQRLAAEVAEGRYDAEISEREMREHLAAGDRTRAAAFARPFVVDATKKPFVVLVAGVNGTGKTTTIGKLAAKLESEGQARDARRGRYVSCSGDRAAEDLGRARERARDRARAGRRCRGACVRGARKSEDRKGRCAADRHGRTLAEQRPG